MKLIIGLGNPGKKYENTRHNIGFMILDKTREQYNFSPWEFDKKFNADISQGEYNGEKTLLVKPQTFMNLSGESVQKIMQFYKLSPDDITVIYDDKDMDFGKIRERNTGSAGGHNGVKNIIAHIGPDWKRIKIGVGKTPAHYDTSDWVLSKMSEEELIDIDNDIYQNISALLSGRDITPEKLDTKKPKAKKQKKHKIYFVGIGGIGVSALARYYLSKGYEVSGSDSTDSALIHALQDEGIDVIIGADARRITPDIEKIVYSEAVPLSQEEIARGHTLDIPLQKYTQALGEIANTQTLIAVSGTHGKSTTTSMISQILKNTDESFSTIVGTLLKEFDGKNFYSQEKTANKQYFVIEACEYKNHFHAYTPTVGVITNIEYDHADFFKTPQEYLDSFSQFIENIVIGGFVIMDADDTNSQKLFGKRNDIHYIMVGQKSASVQVPGGAQMEIAIPEIHMNIPGEHITFDAKIAYVVTHMIGIKDEKILSALEQYSGVWRRMETIGTTDNGNILMSDYAHHPTEIQTTLDALKKGYPDTKLFVVFQPHQYSRTIELLDGFVESFVDADSVVIPDIYESRDSEENKAKMNTQKFVDALNHPNAENGQGMENTLKLIKKYDSENPESSILLLLGAGDVDTLREKIKTH